MELRLLRRPNLEGRQIGGRTMRWEWEMWEGS